MANFEVRTEQRSGELVIHLVGELDLAAFDEVNELLTSAQSDGYRGVRIDLRALEFIDSIRDQTAPDGAPTSRAEGR